MNYRLPHAVNNGFEENRQSEFAEGGHDEALAAVRQTVSDLLAKAPVPPATLTVRAGAVAVELTWNTGPASGPVAGPEAAAAPASEAPAAANGTDVLTASTVGVFYQAASPGAAPFVAEGDQVVPGQQVAIIEAMKLMLPVEADRAGRVVEVLVSDGESVEYGQPLFRIAPVEQ